MISLRSCYGSTVALTLTLLSSFLVAGSVLAEEVVLETPVPAEPIIAGSKHLLASKSLEREVEVLIGLPRGYHDGGHRYPTLYVLDGSAFFEMVTSISRGLAASHAMPECIVVAIRQGDRRAELGGGKAASFAEFLRSELIPYIEGAHRTVPFRILLGHSLGASFALRSLLEDADLFGAYLAISPVLDRPGLVGTEQVAELMRGNGELRGYLSLSKGSETGRYQETIPLLARLLQQDTPKSFSWSYREFPEDDHGLVPFPATYYGLKDLYQGWILPEMADLGGFNSEEDLETLGGLGRIREHYVELSNRLGYSVSVPAIVFSRVVWILHGAGRHPELMELLRKEGEGQTEVLLYLGYRYLEAGETDHALEVFEANTRLHPEAALAWSSLGDGQASVQSLELAEISYRKAMELAADSPHLAEIRKRHGELLRKLQDDLPADQEGSEGP